jgi:hypothetical protein
MKKWLESGGLERLGIAVYGAMTLWAWTDMVILSVLVGFGLFILFEVTRKSA